MLETFLVALLGELFDRFLDHLPQIIADLQQIQTSTLIDASPDPTLQTELTNALDQAIISGAAPAP